MMNTREVFVIVQMVTAEIYGNILWKDEIEAQKCCDKINSLGTYLVITLFDHIESLMTHFNTGYDNMLD